MTTPRMITAEQTAAMMRDGAVLIDIRDEDEHRRLHIPGAVPAPLNGLPTAMPAAEGRAVIFHCRSGIRTAANAQRLATCADGDACILAGGLDAWRNAGLPVVEDRGQPLEIMRQVQICAGTLILAGVLLGAFVAPGFYALAGLVGVGLVMAGVTGFCGMARLLIWFNGRLAAHSH